MNTDMPPIPEENVNDDVTPGGGPAEGEDAASAAPNPNPDAVHPDYSPTVPGAAAPAPTTAPGTTEESGSEETSSDES
jgi:hypothetical protein